nr:fasciculation and elongation protein zeta-2-like [Lytechinus pictus]
MPLDWQNSHTRRKHMPTLRLVEKRPHNDDLDLSEDDELLQSLDLHSMILSSRSHHDVDDMDTPVVTADEVIEELDEMFQSTDTTPDEVIEEDRLSNISRELQALRNRSMTTSSYEESKVAQGRFHGSKLSNPIPTDTFPLLPQPPYHSSPVCSNP